MMNDINQNNYVDLNSLPKDKRGYIDWAKSVGYNIPFIYGDINGQIVLLDYIVKKKIFKIFIDGYTKDQYDTINIDSIKQCRLGRLLHKKIIDTNPEMIKYFVDKNDALKYSCQSNIRTDVKCPFCGHTKKQIISNLYQYGFSCPQCSDGVSYPNKLMLNILKQLDIEFKNEITKRTPGFEWVDKYRYDFYFQTENNKYFIEMDGHFHKNERLCDYGSVIQSDNIKNNLAHQHGIDIIRINCCYDKISNRLNFIKNEIRRSILNDILNICDVDWDIANKAAVSSNIYFAAQYWNEGCTVKQLTEKLFVSRDTITGYLKIAADIGLCDYNEHTSRQRKIKSCILAKATCK